MCDNALMLLLLLLLLLPLLPLLLLLPLPPLLLLLLLLLPPPPPLVTPAQAAAALCSGPRSFCSGLEPMQASDKLLMTLAVTVFVAARKSRGFRLATICAF
jgi:hypothetical protein